MSALTEQERGYVFAHFDEEERHIGDCILVEDVERIVAAREAALAERIVAAREAALAERIAQAIEASADRRDPTGKQYADESQGLLRTGFANGLDHAARIAREIGGQS